MCFQKKKLPNHGFKIKLNYVFPECWSQTLRPRFSQLLNFIPLGIRYLIYTFYIWCRGRKPLMDYLHCERGKQLYGVPLGGIGSGSINRGFKGEFCRYQMKPGCYEYKTIHGNQFILCVRNISGEILYQKVLNCGGQPKNSMEAWDWSLSGESAEYTGLYPRSWTVFDIPEQNLKLICRQISPIFPNNYKDTCIPGAVFVWDIENNSCESKIISITFTFQNGIGESEDKKAGCWSQLFEKNCSKGKVIGALIHHTIAQMNYTFGIAALKQNNVEIRCLKKWKPLSSGKELWDWITSELSSELDTIPSPPTAKGEQLGVAVSAKTTVPKECSANLEFSLVWDLPEVHFGLNEKRYWKYYTRFFGKKDNGPKLCSYCIENYARWEDEIEKWQLPILQDPELPDWYKSALFNETYFVSDGGTIWLDIDESKKNNFTSDDPRIEFGHFAYLEGHEYRMYNTYDVHFYASFAIALLWPKLQAVLQRDFCDTIRKEDRSWQWHLYKGDITFRKVKMSVPHDLGDPGEEPFLKINAYPIHDVSEWRDLDLKFVLQSYRDFSLTGDYKQLEYLWDNICALMNRALRWDQDGDGLIENQGGPDQTYDIWTMTGPSAYCGSLWLAALQCTCEMASILSDVDVEKQFSVILKKAKEAFDEKLWNGQYYNFDCSATRMKTIMSDQLCGLWYLECCGLENKILPDAKVISSLRTIYENNVMKFQGGNLGAVNGMLPSGEVDTHTLQSEEIWTGVVYALTSLMIHKGMVEEGWTTGRGIYETVYYQIGLGYETPEALHWEKKYRAIGYMRPLAIWSVQLAWERKKHEYYGFRLLKS